MDALNRGLPIVIGVGIVVITAVLAKIFLFGNKKIYPDLKQMFPEICLEVANAIGGNTLIPSPSLDASMHLLPLKVVTMREKRKMVLFDIKEYTACDFSLTDLLIDEPVLNLEITDNKCSSYSLNMTFNWRGRFGILIKKLVGFSFWASIEDLITSKCGQLLLREIGNNSIISALKNRKLNMKHYLIHQIDKTKTVLCVVKGVVIASDEVQIKDTRKRDFKKKGAGKSSDTKLADCGADVSTERVMVLSPETTLAYKVWELEVIVNNGHIMPILTEGYSGGFIEKGDGDPPPPSDGDPPPPSDGDPPPPSDGDPTPPSDGDPPPPSDEIQNNRSDKPNDGDPPPPSDEIQKNRSDKPNERDPPPPSDAMKSVKSDEPFGFELLPDFSGIFSHLGAMKSVRSDEPFRFELLPDFSGIFSHLGAVKLVLSDGQFRFEALPESIEGFLRIFGMFILSNQPYRFELLPESSGGCSHINAMKSVQSDEQFRFELLPESIGGISPICAMKSLQSDEQFRFKLLPESIGGFSSSFAKKSMQSDKQVIYELLLEFSGRFPNIFVMTSVQSDEEFRFELLSESSGEFSTIFAMMWMRSNRLFRFKLLPEFSGGFSHLNAKKSVQSDEQFRLELLPDSSGEFSKIFAMTSVQSDEQFRFGLLPEYSGGFSHVNDMMEELADQQCRFKLLPESSGGCSHINVEDNVAELLKDFKNILQPLHDCAKAEDEHIKYSLLVLMTCSSDVLALSKILSKAEDGRLNEDKDTLDKQFINNDTVWSILTDVGVQTEDGRVLCEGKATPILTAVSYMIDAILELDNDHLNIIYQCDEQQLKTLLKIFESAVASKTTIDVDMSSVLKEPVSSFLTRQKFTVCNDSIQPPKAKTCILECIFCVLYCLS